jgi:hypothetical protein
MLYPIELWVQTKNVLKSLQGRRQARKLYFPGQHQQMHKYCQSIWFVVRFGL